MDIPYDRTFLFVSQIFDLVTLTSNFDLILKKTPLNLGFNFWTQRDPKR